MVDVSAINGGGYGFGGESRVAGKNRSGSSTTAARQEVEAELGFRPRVWVMIWERVCGCVGDMNTDGEMECGIAIWMCLCRGT